MELEDVFRSHQREIVAYFQRVVGNRQDAEDLAQETFLRAYSAALRFRGDASVRTWLFGIARRVLLEASRRGLFDRPEQIRDRPELEEDHAERLDLEAALRRLGPLDREALVLVDVLQFEPTDAAKIIGIEATAFRMRLHRARERFRKEYDP